jgi:hypothetical protein
MINKMRNVRSIRLVDWRSAYGSFDSSEYLSFITQVTVGLMHKFTRTMRDTSKKVLVKLINTEIRVTIDAFCLIHNL